MTSQADAGCNRFSTVSLLVVDDDKAIREACKNTGTAVGLTVYSASSAREGLALMERVPVDIVLTDLRMPGLSGFELLQQLRKANPDVVVLMMSGYGSIETAVEAMQRGTYDFLSKPFRLCDLKAKLIKVAEECISNAKAQRLRNEVAEIGGFSLVIGRSTEMQQIYRVVSHAANSSSPVLILGEPGTGKELLARSIHLASKNSSDPIIPVDCCSLMPSMLESELFGHVRGAFKGAATNKLGLLASAENGTVFLDEIGHLSLQAQTRLVRVLQDKVIHPLGGSKTIPFRARIVATSNTDLPKAVQVGSFRQDLYYRLSVLTVRLPALRDRKDDIPLIVDYFLGKLSEEHGERKSVSSDVMRDLEAFSWPGNVRQLETVLERAYMLATGRVITRHEIGPLDARGSDPQPESKSPIMTLADIERIAVERALAHTGGDKVEAARILGISRTTLYRKLNEYNLPE